MYWMMLTPTGWQKIQLGGKPRAPLWNWLHDRTQTANRSFFPGILHYLLTMSDPIPSPLWNLGFAKFSFNSSALSSTLPQYAKGCVQDILKAPFEVRTFEAIWCILDLGSLAQLAFKLLVWTLQPKTCLGSLARFKDLSSETGTTFCLSHFPLPAYFIRSKAMQIMKCKLPGTGAAHGKYEWIKTSWNQSRWYRKVFINKKQHWCRAQITLVAMVNNQSIIEQKPHSAWRILSKLNCAPRGTGLLGYCMLRLEVCTTSPFQRLGRLQFLPNLRFTTSAIVRDR